MIKINMHEAKTHLSRYAERVMAGEEIVIAKAGTPIMKLVPYVPDRPLRMPGLLREQAGAVSEPDWFEQDQATEQLFEFGSIDP